MSGAERAFLDGYYAWAAPIYDLTRKPYLLGRDRVLSLVAAECRRGLVVEVGAGTGRNLERLRARAPELTLGAVEPCRPMRERLVARCPDVRVVDAWAEEIDLVAAFGETPRAVIFSYCLSMIPEPGRALAHVRRQLPRTSTVWVVDFGPFDGGPRWARAALRRWLATFHVRPPGPLHASSFERGPGGYYVIDRLAGLAD